MSTEDVWIGIEDIAAEMRYTERQAWEFIRSIGLASVNARKMDLVRFKRADFEEAVERSKAPIAARHRVNSTPPAVEPAPSGKGKKESAAALLAKLRGA